MNIIARHTIMTAYAHITALHDRGGNVHLAFHSCRWSIKVSKKLLGLRKSQNDAEIFNSDKVTYSCTRNS